MIQKQDICGIILAGGKSSRMGTDKTFLKYNNKSFIDTAIDLLSPFCSELLISSNPKNHLHIKYRIIEDEYKDCGPIGGIFSCLKASLKESNLIIPVDMPYITTDLIDYLIMMADPERVSVIRLPNGFIEPLCAIYPKNTFKLFEKAIIKGNYKLISLLKSLDFKAIDVNNSLSFYKEDMFSNVNTLEDYNYLK